ncbi:hypothetical protein BpHYR1_042868 [Brachionus plicatilis]|uniref:Uncharacterized protein n=1 Tax=Brachionus plicatilis TaxID=10195 RepID=A0A3M7PV55_BRAPC|nr:hypothetical protein BpHYR1_042868 [Brachionus plicatilis]
MFEDYLMIRIFLFCMFSYYIPNKNSGLINLEISQKTEEFYLEYLYPQSAFDNHNSTKSDNELIKR